LKIQYSAINDLGGLAELKTITGYLLVYYTTNLPSLAGLDGLTEVGDIAIEHADLLTNLSGLENLTSIGSLSVVRNAKLPNLNGLPQALPSVFNLEIFGNPLMTSLEGMPAFGEIQHSLRIGENDSLSDISALEFSAFPVGDDADVDISVNRNPLLTSLSGLPPIDKIWSLSITENCVLKSLDGLEGLIEVWSGLVIFDNPVLGNCLAMRAVLDEVDDGAPGPATDPEDPPDSPGLPFITIERNYIGCNSLEQVLTIDPANIIFANQFEGSWCTD
jgi:hypothetical protein